MKGKKTGGRKTKLTDEVHNTIMEVLIEGNYDKVAAAVVGIDDTTFQHWERRGEADEEVGKIDPKGDAGIYIRFSRAVKISRTEGHRAALKNIRNADEWQASAWYLERKHPTLWGRRDRLRLEISKNTDEIIERLDKLDEIDAMERILAGDDPAIVLMETLEALDPVDG